MRALEKQRYRFVLKCTTALALTCRHPQNRWRVMTSARMREALSKRGRVGDVESGGVDSHDARASGKHNRKIIEEVTVIVKYTYCAIGHRETLHYTLQVS